MSVNLKSELFRIAFRQEALGTLAREALNQIDDYFEYGYESKQDRDAVYKILDEYATAAKKIDI